ncbi:hypothetical protein, partial [Dickeya dadantii]|uniref:hypothetical protein n=1 Tax=Dickeya dadantii TaxID=204038 RepID=UPI001C130A57
GTGFRGVLPLTRRSRSPQHSFNAGKTLHFALIEFVSNLRAAKAALYRQTTGSEQAERFL